MFPKEITEDPFGLARQADSSVFELCLTKNREQNVTATDTTNSTKR